MTQSGAPAKNAIPVTQTLEAQDYRHQRMSHELYQHALIGPVFYILGYVLVVIVGGFYREGSWCLVFPIVAFALLWWLRFRHRPLEKGASLSDYRSWYCHQWALILMGALIWGLISGAVAYLERKPESAVLVSLITTIAMSAAASQTFAMHPMQSRVCILFFLLPSIMVFALPALQLRSISITLAIYSAYLMANLSKCSKEYAQQLEVEIELISSRAELARMSMTDGLTGLQNRLSYEQVWPRAWHGAARKKEALALMMFDLDHFKAINDQHGHMIGDACLRHFGQVLHSFARRDSDFVARIGGEEFIMLLPATTVEAAQMIAEKIRQNLASTPCFFGKIEVRMTVSVGVGTVDWDADFEPQSSFSRIDHACYLAKNAGRNCVVTA